VSRKGRGKKEERKARTCPLGVFKKVLNKVEIEEQEENQLE